MHQERQANNRLEGADPWLSAIWTKEGGGGEKKRGDNEPSPQLLCSSAWKKLKLSVKKNDNQTMGPGCLRWTEFSAMAKSQR